MMIRNRLKQAEVALLRSMTDEQLREISGNLDLSSFSDAELQSMIDGTASPALVRKFRDAEAKAEASK